MIGPLSDGRCMAADKASARMARYAQGMSDADIARHEGITAVAILRWRRKRDLQPNVKACLRIEPDKPKMTQALRDSCQALLRRGAYGDIVAQELGIPPATVRGWCKAIGADWQSPPRPRHPYGKPFKVLSGDRRLRAIDLYMQGFPDPRIAKALDCAVTKVREWRLALFLPINRSKTTAADRDADNAVYALLRRAVGTRTASDIADDAIAEMWLALADGRLSTDRVTSEGGRFAKRAWNNATAAFGDRSLDEQMGDGDGQTLLDIIPDACSSDWLEEMGATVW